MGAKASPRARFELVGGLEVSHSSDGMRRVAANVVEVNELGADADEVNELGADADEVAAGRSTQFGRVAPPIRTVTGATAYSVQRTHPSRQAEPCLNSGSTPDIHAGSPPFN